VIQIRIGSRFNGANPDQYRYLARQKLAEMLDVSLKGRKKTEFCFVGILKVTDEKRGSRAGSVSQRYGFPDPIRIGKKCHGSGTLERSFSPKFGFRF
jgi:hypothetical protein